MDLAIDFAQVIPNIAHTQESALIAEIERAKLCIKTQITDAMDRTNLRVDTILQNTLVRSTQDTYVHHSTDTTLNPRNLDICAASDIKHTQDSMDDEIARLRHLSTLMHTLYHGIERATFDLQQKLRVPPTIANESTTIAKESLTIANENPTIANESTTIAKESLTIANENPTIANESTTIAKDSLAIANENPTNVQEIPTIANERSTFAKDRPAPANDHLTLANDSPTIAYEPLTIINESTFINKARLTESTYSNHHSVELLLMMNDHTPLDEDEQTMRDMDAERTEALQLQLLQLGLDEQRHHDLELSQLHEDILHHDNETTEQIIADFEHNNSSSDANDGFGTSPVNDFNYDWWVEPPDSDDETINHDTHQPSILIGNVSQLNDNFEQVEKLYHLDDDNESDDNDNNAANIAELLQANIKLLDFLTQQSATIARLRTRIVRLKTLIYDLYFRPGVPVPERTRLLTRETRPPLSQVTTYYGIRRGLLIGVCDSWEELKQRIAGYPNPRYQSFSTWQAAKEYVLEGMWNDMPDAARRYATPLPAQECQSCSTSDTASRHPSDQATVLVDTVDTAIDTSFLLKPHDESAVELSRLDHTEIQKQLAIQLAKINDKRNLQDELWMYFDSGASRSVISTTSPIRTHLQGIGPAYGSCSIGDGTPLHYLEKGNITNNLEVTVVNDLKYDLFSSVSAAKQGLTSIIDYDLRTGQNKSFTIDKLTGNITPLVERGKGILELPLHLMLPSQACVSLPHNSQSAQDELPPHVVSMFWHHYDDASFDPAVRENNTTEYSLFTFDIIKSLSERERHFLIHARLGHLPRTKILQMIKNGTTGISDYTGKFKELCKPCLQARQRAENHGKEHRRHPKGRPGEHLHSDLAVLSTVDINGNKYVLTVVDEISHEIVIALLKRKTAEDVHHVCKKIQLSITARTGNKLLTWQFDRGTEFLNSTFEKWLKMDLGVIQRFSNIEHPWENGVAERSFQTLFNLARSLLKHADLPDRIWGKALLHSVYLNNRSPAAALGGIAPLQFRTKEPINLHHMRVFGSPAQIFVRPTIRSDPKLSDRSISGTFVGISDKGNGYIFLVNKYDTLVEVDSKDAKFNETFSDYRGRQGKIMVAPFIAPDLRDESEIHHKEDRRKETTSITEKDDDNSDTSNDDNTQRPYERLKRHTTPRKFLLPGTHSKHVRFQPQEDHLKHELDIRKQQYSNLCMDNLMEQDEANFLLNCMEASIDEESILLRELELLTACAICDGDEEILMPTITTDQVVDLNIPDPKSQSEIDRMDPKDARRFNDATISEVNGMKGKNVFVNTTMADLPPGTKVYESVVNWTSKTNLGVYVKTKCRICFGGHRYDKTYADTFAPTVNFCTVLVIICLSAMFGWAMGSLDYSQAYLNANIDEICVMRAPISVREYSPNGREYFWLLKKAIYGHPKASRLWAECLHNKLLQLGYSQFLTDQCVYGRWQAWDASTINDNVIPENSHFIFLLIHSDDIIIVSHSETIMNEAKAELLNAFQGTDNGNLSSFCGVEVRMNDHTTSLSMEYYWNKLMRKFNVKDNEIENSPIKTKIKRSECPAEPDANLKTSYLQIIGSIIYGYTHCRLDLAFPVNMLTRIMHSPAEQHYNLLRKLLQYINGTKNWTLNYYRDCTVYYGMDFVFFCNVDAAHADDDETFRSTGGWFFFLRKGQGAVAAKSGQTKDIPLSSTESETIWGSSAAMQGAFLKQFLDETRLFKSSSFEIHEDSQPMINAQKRNVSQSRFKHMKTKHHYIRKLIFDGWCKLIKIPSKMNTADMATKILPANQVSIFSKVVLGLQDSLLYFTEHFTEFD
jgi:transposase InsO family protein